MVSSGANVGHFRSIAASDSSPGGPLPDQEGKSNGSGVGGRQNGEQRGHQGGGGGSISGCSTANILFPFLNLSFWVASTELSTPAGRVE